MGRRALSQHPVLLAPAIQLSSTLPTAVACQTKSRIAVLRPLAGVFGEAPSLTQKKTVDYPTAKQAAIRVALGAPARLAGPRRVIGRTRV